MRGTSSDTARHVMCSSQNKRVSVTFFKVRTEMDNNPSRAMTLWQPGVPTPRPMPNTYGPMNMMPKWGLLRAPLVMLSPVRPLLMGPRRVPRGGTGVFLPWNSSSRKHHAKHLPPRAQRGRFPALPSAVESRKPDTVSDSGVMP